MITCGLKLTHDGSVCIVDGDKLISCTEIEKICDNLRYSPLCLSSHVEQILAQEGLSVNDVDTFVIDGWDVDKPPSFYNEGMKAHVNTASYMERYAGEQYLKAYVGRRLRIGEQERDFVSYMHVVDHVCVAWATSPFARTCESCHVLLWDGGVPATLYWIDPECGAIEHRGILLGFLGHVYPIFAQFYMPFLQDVVDVSSLSIAGKVMAYIALGQDREEISSLLERRYNEMVPNQELVTETSRDASLAVRFASRLVEDTKRFGFRDADVLSTFHHFIGRKIVQSLRSRRAGESMKKLCITGGCGLNIKWNSAVREAAICDELWVPPFPNDSGSSIGAVCAHRFALGNRELLSWNVYLGPKIVERGSSVQWRMRGCTIEEVALLLLEKRAVVILNGRAEIGPRALGNRSILADASDIEMKTRLNRIKNREWYRPVAPICLEHRAREVFDPGTPDPFMLYDHRVRGRWSKRVPAIVHEDGTARLQTLNEHQNSVVYGILVAYERLSGLPLLCNTSANLSGRGFFPSVSSAIEWGGVDHVWSNAKLWYRDGS